MVELASGGEVGLGRLGSKATPAKHDKLINKRWIINITT